MAMHGTPGIGNNQTTEFHNCNRAADETATNRLSRCSSATRRTSAERVYIASVVIDVRQLDCAGGRWRHGLLPKDRRTVIHYSRSVPVAAAAASTVKIITPGPMRRAGAMEWTEKGVEERTNRCEYLKHQHAGARMRDFTRSIALRQCAGRARRFGGYST